MRAPCVYDLRVRTPVRVDARSRARSPARHPTSPRASPAHPHLALPTPLTAPLPRPAHPAPAMPWHMKAGVALSTSANTLAMMPRPDDAPRPTATVRSSWVMVTAKRGEGLVCMCVWEGGKQGSQGAHLLES